MEEKIIEKIKKILELSKNNPSEEESKAAVLKAQELMAKYHVEMIDIEDESDIEEITESGIEVGTGNKWKMELCNIVARNFRCKCYHKKGYGMHTIMFYGYETDCKIATETFKYLFEVGNKGATSYYNKKRNESMKNHGFFVGNGIKNSYLYGFMIGIKECLEKQSTALMVVVPEEVKQSFTDMTKSGFKTSTTKGINVSDGNAYKHGKLDGKHSLESRKLATA